MSAVTLPARSAEGPRGPRIPTVLRLSAGRLLRLELRRSTMMWMVPLALLAFWLDTYRSSMALPALWGSRTLILRQGMAVDDFAPFVVGAAAWIGGRDRRRGIGEQVDSTPLPRWAGRTAAWAASTGWAVGTYLACVGFLYAVIAWQGAAGSPPWWPLPVGAMALAACSAVGFAIGVLVPSRFTAPLAAIVTALVLRQTLRSGGRYVLLSPMVSPAYSLSPPRADAGVFYPYLPDLSITQLLFLGGLTVAAVGMLGVQAVCGGRGLRRLAASVVAVGLALSGTGVALIGTARVEAKGVVVPALHDAADDRPVAYTPVCGGAGVQVCLNPVYRAYLPTVTAALAPLLREVAGLPGAPVRVDQVDLSEQHAVLAGAVVAGDPPVARLALNIGYDGAMWIGPGAPGSARASCCTSQQLWSSVPRVTEQVLPPVAAAVVDHLVGHADQAQQAVSAGLLTASGVPLDSLAVFAQLDGVTSTTPQPGSPAYLAGARFAALPAAARHAWLTAHFAELRAGALTLEQLP
ncbi:hypothetical protein [Streptacidiphilus carbonis]|uniref:hypothetical protein n=1 Tax=Streptacidiphilus carbonis TaxID=105422 RepID=UPI0005A997FE|nr:hypothetical protein [Streptacidiphilus carbonis]